MSEERGKVLAGGGGLAEDPAQPAARGPFIADRDAVLPGEPEARGPGQLCGTLERGEDVPVRAGAQIGPRRPQPVNKHRDGRIARRLVEQPGKVPMRGRIAGMLHPDLCNRHICRLRLMATPHMAKGRNDAVTTA
jgi:hypothetical protein